ncbi:glycerophosphodiester phosphodiesterase [Campylobacter upsaliensis]
MKKITFVLIFLGLNLFASDKLIIAHRGASAYLPEHTLESKVLAFAQGVPYIEQDVVLSKDDRLVVIHDLYLDKTSDVAQKFPERKRKDGHYYVIDFTLDELKSLKMSEGFKGENDSVNAYPKRFPTKKADFTINTLEEEIELIQGLNKTLNKNVGIYVETKRPWFHKQEGKDISKLTLEVLKKYGYTDKDSKVYFQSFDYPDLVRVKKELLPQMGMNIKLVGLIGLNEWEETFEFKNGKWQNYDFSYLLNIKNYAEISKIVDGLGPTYVLLFDERELKNHKIVPNDFVKNAHKYNIKVHPYTIRADALPSWAKSADELFDAILFKAGADGVFTDFPDLGLEFLRRVRC